MFSDIVALREFYQTAPGRNVRRLLCARLGEAWPNLRGERILVLGYGAPLLRPLQQQALATYALMPAAQGAVYWPREGPNISALVDFEHLPLTDNSIDRVIALHALEAFANPTRLLGEIGRVMKGGARFLAIVPNRRGLWAHSDRTPFGTGQPYSSFQIKDMLRDHGFLAERAWSLLYTPPGESRLLLSLSDGLEKFGSRWFPGLGGLLMVEAGKQLYAPALTKPVPLRHRLLFPLPLPPPLPAGRIA